MIPKGRAIGHTNHCGVRCVAGSSWHCGVSEISLKNPVDIHSAALRWVGLGAIVHVYNMGPIVCRYSTIGRSKAYAAQKGTTEGAGGSNVSPYTNSPTNLLFDHCVNTAPLCCASRCTQKDKVK